MMRLQDCKKFVLDTLYPPKCYLCGGLLEAGTVCQKCKAKLLVTDGDRRIQYGKHFDRCISYCFYTDQLKPAFHRYKFNGHYHYSRLFGQWMSEALDENGTGPFDFCTWVPLHRFRRWSRGYDQAELLAREVALHTGIPLVKALDKTRYTAAQSGTAHVAQRYTNVKGVYRLAKGCSVAGKRILLIDDVITTGSTLENAASALREGGAAEIVCLTLARSLHQASAKAE
ncbi:MAG: ComF family protein [Clostridiales bacterium]|nr:ComF family protein [Clostridiales bacterium]